MMLCSVFRVPFCVIDDVDIVYAKTTTAKLSWNNVELNSPLSYLLLRIQRFMIVTTVNDHPHSVVCAKIYLPIFFISLPFPFPFHFFLPRCASPHPISTSQHSCSSLPTKQLDKTRITLNIHTVNLAWCQILQWNFVYISIKAQIYSLLFSNWSAVVRSFIRFL